MKKKLDQKLIFVPALITCGKAKERAASWAFVGEPKNIEEYRLGTVFLVGEVDAEEENGVSSILPLVGSELKQEYYAEPRRRPLASFSESLRKSNLIFAQVPKKRNPMWLGKVHLAGGALTESTLLFSLVGKIHAYLFRNGTTTDLNRRFIQEGRPHPTKLFRHVASGSLLAGDRLLFATPKVFGSLFLEDIRHIVRESPFSEIQRHVEMLYAKENPRASLSLLVLEIRREDSAPIPEKTAMAPASQPFCASGVTRRERAERRSKALAIGFIRQIGSLITLGVENARAKLPHAVALLRKMAFVYASRLSAATQNARVMRVLVIVAVIGLFLLLLLFRREVMF